MSVRSIGALALFVMAVPLVGCDGNPPAPPPPPRRDAGLFDSGTVRMDASMDDGGSSDGSVGDGAVGMDGATSDGGGVDSGPGVDGGGGSDSGIEDASEPPTDSGIDLCAALPSGTPCPCAAGFSCLPNGCGEMRCYPSGRPCGGATDCPTGSSCTAGVCTNPGTGCTDSRECPAGYACESGSCVNRRIGCGIGADCPWGFLCDGLGEGKPFCFRAQTRCTSDSACPLFGQCRDVLGTGQNICHWSSGPGCQNNADCPMIGQVCAVHPVFVDAMCGAYGPCNVVGDCASGFECRDLWGDGVRQCVPSGGSCTNTAGCTAPAICGVPFTGGPPQCITRSL